MCRERAIERRPHYEHRRIEPAAAWSRSGDKCEWNDERREQDEQQTQSINANQILSVDRRNPRMTLDELHTRPSGIELSPQSQRARRGDGVKYQSDDAAISLRPDPDRKRAKQRNENDGCNHANHA